MAISFAKNHIGKSLDDIITVDDLINYFSVEREESLTLEFKSYVADKNGGYSFDGVLRTVAAFLNSEGGLLIFGAPRDIAVRDGYKVVSGPMMPVPLKAITKDGLVNRISDTISYMPIGIRIESIQMKQGDYVYIVEVQESNNKPHQYNKYYYIRLDGQSKTAPHYLVEALFKQERRPDLKGYLRVVSYQFIVSGSYSTPNVIRLSLEVSVFNDNKEINDKGVYIQIITKKGYFFVKNKDGDFVETQLDFAHDISPLITYAMPTRYTFIYQINSNEYDSLLYGQEELEIVIAFGSDKSITRRSDYYISFTNILSNSINLHEREYTSERDLNSLLQIRKNENISMNDVWFGSEEHRHYKVLRGV